MRKASFYRGDPLTVDVAEESVKLVTEVDTAGVGRGGKMQGPIQDPYHSPTLLAHPGRFTLRP